MGEKKSIIILGSTGSVGQQTLKIVDDFPDRYEVYALSANSNEDLLIEQAKKYLPDTVVIADESKYQKVQDALWEDEVKVYAGKDSLKQIVTTSEVKIIVNALLGFSGLEPTIEAIKSGKRVALANKESLVVAGPIIAKLLEKYPASIIPIDSEHSAIFQCLVGEFDNPIEKIFLTASGGPFRGKSPEELGEISVSEATNHPNWKMGKKISVDSATMINKGFEMIEAQWLFGIKPDQIEILMHPESLIHSMVQFGDGSVKAQMGVSDMRIPIQYALSFPERLNSKVERMDFFKNPKLNFEAFDLKNYPNLNLVIKAMEEGGIKPCILNAANEVAVESFLQLQIGFNQIAEINQQTIEAIPNEELKLENLNQIDQKAREIAKSFI